MGLTSKTRPSYEKQMVVDRKNNPQTSFLYIIRRTQMNDVVSPLLVQENKLIFTRNYSERAEGLSE